MPSSVAANAPGAGSGLGPGASGGRSGVTSAGMVLNRRQAARAESGVKRNIPGPCGKALAGGGDSGWGDGGWDASGAGGTGAAGRAQGRGAEPAGDRAGAR